MLSLGLCLVVLFVADSRAQSAGASQPAAGWRFSDHVNTDLPRWFRLSGEYRVRLEGIGAAGFKPASEDAFLLSRVRVNATFLPTPWFRVQLQGQDAQAFWRNQKPDAPPYEDTFDVRQGYLEFGNSETNRFGVRVGR